MTLAELRSSLSDTAPPPDLDAALAALWWAAKGDWQQAHAGVQLHEGHPACDWVHAHLHRQEGDLANARYWYRRAGQSTPSLSLTDEWDQVASALLARPTSPTAL